MRLLEIDGLRAGYGDHEILRGVGLHVEPGEIVAIIGPNGAGKSTLLRTIAGLLDQWGGTNFNPPSFDPALGLFFVNSRETCATYVTQEPKMVPGRANMGGAVRVVDATKAYGALRAIDPTTGERRWEFRYTSPTMAGVMTTASGLVFAGDHEGNFMAFDSHTGKNLWRYQTDTSIWGAAPMTYMLDGRQWVVVPSGVTLTAFALPEG